MWDTIGIISCYFVSQMSTINIFFNKNRTFFVSNILKLLAKGLDYSSSQQQKQQRMLLF